MSYGDFLFLLEHPDFEAFVDELWAFRPLDSEYTARLGQALSLGAVGAVGFTTSDQQVDDEEEKNPQPGTSQAAKRKKSDE